MARFMLPGLFLVAITILVLSPVAATESGTKPQAPVPLYTEGICDTSDVVSSTGLIGPKSNPQSGPKWLFEGAPKHASEFLVARIQACGDIISAWNLAAPTPAAVISGTALPQAPGHPNSSCEPATYTDKNGKKVNSNDPIRQYAMLQYCVAYVKMYVTQGTPTPPPVAFLGNTPQQIIKSPDTTQRTWNKYVYVLALATDAPTSAQLSYRLRDALLSPNEELNTLPRVMNEQEKDPYLSGVTDKFNLVAAPSWTLGMFQAQCFNDPATAGAIVALQPSQQGSTFNFVLMNQWTVLAWQTVVIECEPTNTAYTDNAAFIRWESTVESGRANSFSMSLAWALGAMAGVAAFNPTKQTTYMVAAPSPTAKPGQSYPTQYTIGSPSNATGAFAAAGVAALSPLNSSSSPNLFDGNEADGLVAAAIAKAVPKVRRDLFSPCPSTLSSAGAPPPPPQCTWFTAAPSASP